MTRNFLLILTFCFSTFGCAHSCGAQQDDQLNQMGPNVQAGLVFFFKKGTGWKEILEFHRTTIGIPDPRPNSSGHSLLPGMMSIVKIDLDGFEGEAINFQPDASDEEKAFVKKRVLDSLLVYKIYENVVPSEITDLNPNRKTALPSNKVSEPSPRKLKKVVRAHDP
ncbi:MAG: hypothetical protein ABL999_19665 [Pyrinomonadaceae bacterium]